MKAINELTEKELETIISALKLLVLEVEDHYTNLMGHKGFHAPHGIELSYLNAKNAIKIIEF